MAYPSITINQRFATLIQVLNLTKSGFAQSLDKTPSVVQHLIDGRNKPGYDLLCRVFEVYPNVSRDWLILGRGPMLLSGAAPELPPMPVAGANAPELPLQPPAAVAPAVFSAAPELPLGFTVATSSALPPPGARPQPRSAPDAPLGAADIAAVLAASARASRPAADENVVAPAPSVASVAPVAAAAPLAADAFVAALHVQQLQHQLAVAELRNQHLLEQQAMLREMLEMAKGRA